MFLMDLQRYLTSEGDDFNRVAGETVVKTFDAARYKPEVKATFEPQPDPDAKDEKGRRPGAVALPSVHLQQGAAPPDRPFQVEDLYLDVGAEKARIEHSQIIMPDLLVGKSDAELHSLGRKATFKLDCFIMPCVVIMYILNYLDRQV